MRHFAVIGTRDPSSRQKEWVQSILVRESSDSVLHTGAAPGVDQLAADAWLELGRAVHLHLPWSRYEATWIRNRKVDNLLVTDAEYINKNTALSKITVDGYQDHKHNRVAEFRELARVHHPKWDKLGRGPRALHIRNGGIVTPCEKVYAAPGTKPWGGGTAMGIKIALHLGIELELCDPLEDRKWDSCGCK